jgi:hypothetical protein
MKKDVVLKTKGQRVTETIEILQNLKNIGADKDSGYLEIKQVLDKWILDGESWAGKIQFPRYGRFADLILPQRADRKPTCVLRATDALLQAEKNESTDS